MVYFGADEFKFLIEVGSSCFNCIAMNGSHDGNKRWIRCKVGQ